MCLKKRGLKKKSTVTQMARIEMHAGCYRKVLSDVYVFTRIVRFVRLIASYFGNNFENINGFFERLTAYFNDKVLILFRSRPLFDASRLYGCKADHLGCPIDQTARNCGSRLFNNRLNISNLRNTRFKEKLVTAHHVEELDPLFGSSLLVPHRAISRS